MRGGQRGPRRQARVVERGQLGSMEEAGVEESGRVVSGVQAGGTGEHGAPMREGEEGGSPKCYPPAPGGLSSADAGREVPQELIPPPEEEMGTEAVEDGSEKCYPPGQMERPWMEARVGGGSKCFPLAPSKWVAR